MKEAKDELKSILNQAIENLSTDYKGESLTDIFILVDQESGELSVYDDEENCVSKGIVESWIHVDSCDDENLTDSVYAHDLRAVIAEMDEAERFASLDVYKPFSVNFADENFIVIEELLLIEDDSVIRIENELMDRLDKEFDEFLDKLLNE